MVCRRSRRVCNVANRRCAVHLTGMSDENRNTNEKEFGARLKSMRERRGLTQEQLAEMSGLASDTIRRAEHGAFAPSLRTMNKMAAGLAVPVHALLRDDFDEADDLAECIRALPEREFRIAIAMVRVLGRLAVGQPTGEDLTNG
jgi:transcriptional regulator with XRE-family HTH domain